ncbi:hypothetical protein B0T19DRAFT_77080 [Cercophora scortea]|uniref:Uncharacterized protein n=1 Tax=Cercophora scortea TaxID=314031 RepID=A0AAE0MMV4_9PEZI|nr:hypothetical protein B0T19DRAFT_77080 [Cercophora scortea]
MARHPWSTLLPTGFELSFVASSQLAIPLSCLFLPLLYTPALPPLQPAMADGTARQVSVVTCDRPLRSMDNIQVHVGWVLLLATLAASPRRPLGCVAASGNYRAGCGLRDPGTNLNEARRAIVHMNSSSSSPRKRNGRGKRRETDG